MESKSDTFEHDWDDNRSRGSFRSRKSRAPSGKKHYKSFRERTQDEKATSKAEMCPSDPDRASDGEGRRSKATSYSDEYESERSLSPYERDQTLSPPPLPPTRANLISSSSPYNTGMERRVRARPPRPGRSRASRSLSKESLPPKDLDPLTRQMLSGRLLKINELRNVHGELQLRIAELQKENRILKQLHTRQEKALQNYTDAESKISQMLSCHASETHVLRERLRRTRERERAAERRLKEKEEQLLRSHATVGRMKKLVEQRELGAREELSCKLEQERARTHEAELKIKELERNMELSNGSHQRQLAAERKKTLCAQEEIKNLQKELEQLASRLREKERELEIRNIYAHRLGKVSPRKAAAAADGESKLKAEAEASFHKAHRQCKAVQTRSSSSPEFPSPPPPAEYSDPAPDGYLSLKQVEVVDGGPKAKQEQQRKTSHDRRTSRDEKETEEDHQQNAQDVREVKANMFTDDKEDDEVGSFLRNPHKSVHVQEEAELWGNHHQMDAGEARRRKDQLLAKMREIDLQNKDKRKPDHVDSSESNAAAAETPSSTPSSGRRRNLCSIRSNEDLVFGSCVDSLGGNPRQNAARDNGDHALEAIGIFSLKGTEEKSKKSVLMQQLFGSLAAPSGDARTAELLDGMTGSGAARGGSRATGRLGFGAAPASVSARHVVDSRPAVRVIPSFDDDIEELAL
ncbi:lebercilin isoform X2 [Syngnathus scovelli]|uniref:lebercilin isoform X2 n=1 Tax=Syngnathus scovelli TaxID=161590 RepID=UPI0021107053|nr:lebercilin isoform X2 [Syngnathus scovelli]